jgi:hypothetical protein
MFPSLRLLLCPSLEYHGLAEVRPKEEIESEVIAGEYLDYPWIVMGRWRSDEAQVDMAHRQPCVVLFDIDLSPLLQRRKTYIVANFKRRNLRRPDPNDSE